MNNNEIITHLSAVINALDHVYVSGRANLNNLGGSITILCELKDKLADELRNKEAEKTEK